MRTLPASDQSDKRHDLPGLQASADVLVPCHASADPGQEQRLRARTHAAPRRVLSKRMADEAQTARRHVAARRGSATHWPGSRSTMPIPAASAQVAHPGAARRTRCPSLPRCRPPTLDCRIWCACRSACSPRSRLAKFIARATVLPLTVVSDALGCFTVAGGMGAVHDRTVTVAARPASDSSSSRRSTPCSANLKTVIVRRRPLLTRAEVRRPRGG